jgi:rubredoxin
MIRRTTSVTLVALALAGLLGACSDDGTSDADASASASTSTTPALSAEEQAWFETASEFASCMRHHGVDGLPDPQLSGNGFMLQGVPLTASDMDAWYAAQEACQYVFEEAAPPDQGGADAATTWEPVVPGGDCQCSDGSRFSFWVREASPERVVLFFDGGGGCFSAETCAPDSGVYNTTITEGPPGEGVFDFADERNPFADYSVVVVPYCTGDVHIGNATTEYTPDLTIQHKGYVNGTAVLDHLTATFPGATDVVVMGESAGSIASPLYAGLVSDRLPDAKVTVLADGSGSYPDLEDINTRLAAAWGTGNTIPPWPENAGLTAEQWSFPGLFIQSGRHDPEIVFARHDYAYDERQAFWYPYFDIAAGDLLSRIDANEAQIESAGVNLLSYVAPGDEHTVLGDAEFYTETVNGQLLVDWVTRLIQGEPVDDVHCTDCNTP